MPPPKHEVRIPQLNLTVSLSRTVTPAELLIVIAELRADVQALAARKPQQ